jgi:hypothetical protein
MMMPVGNLPNHYIWAGTEGERLFVDTEVHCHKFKDRERDPRVTLTIRDDRDLSRYAQVRGEVVQSVTAQEARDRIDEFS